MVDWFIDMFTLGNLGYFFLGVATASAWHLVKARFQGRTVIIKWQYVAIPVAILIAAYMSVQNQQNADCVREFNETLQVRARITSQNDEVSLRQRELIYEWIHGGGSLNRELTQKTDREFADLIHLQREYEQQRAANPLPPATCGK